jgi:hypothetical protein
MENFRRGLHSHAGAGAKTGLGTCFNALKHKNKFKAPKISSRKSLIIPHVPLSSPFSSPSP